MEDALQGALGGRDAAPDVGGARDVARDDLDLDLGPQGRLHQRARVADPLRGPAALGVAVHEDEVAGARGREIADDAQAQSPESAGHEVGRFRVEKRAEIDRPRVAGEAPGRELEGELALVPARHHQAQGVLVAVRGVGGDGERGHVARFEEREARLGEGADEGRTVAEQAVDVDRGGDPGERGLVGRAAARDLRYPDVARSGVEGSRSARADREPARNGWSPASGAPGRPAKSPGDQTSRCFTSASRLQPGLKLKPP